VCFICLRYRSIGTRKRIRCRFDFSQDQDFSEVAAEIRGIALDQNRWISVAYAYPFSPTYDNTRGIYKTDWIRIDQALYDQAIALAQHNPLLTRHLKGNLILPLLDRRLERSRFLLRILLGGNERDDAF